MQDKITPPHEAELGENNYCVSNWLIKALKSYDGTMGAAGESKPKSLRMKAKRDLEAAINTYCYKQVMELIGENVTINPHLDNVNPQEAQNRLRTELRQAAAQRFGQGEKGEL